MQGLLPPEAQALFENIAKYNGEISDQVEPILLKLWNNEPLGQSDMDLDIAPADVAALWSITHRRPFAVAAVRQVANRRKGAWKEPIKPSKEWGHGPTRRCLYRLGDVLEVKIQERTLSASKNQSSQERI